MMRLFHRRAALLAAVLISFCITTPVFAAVNPTEETGAVTAPSDDGWDTSIWQQWDAEVTGDDNTVSVAPSEIIIEEANTAAREEQQTVPEQLKEEDEEEKTKEPKPQQVPAVQEPPAEDDPVSIPAMQEFAPPQPNRFPIGRGILVALLLVAAILIAVSLLRHPAQAESTADDTE